LTRSFSAVGGSCLFTNCVPLTGGTYVAGAGVYLLTVAPAEANEGRAATNGLDPANVRCNTDATVEAVQFRLLAVNRTHYADLDPAANQFRNRLAYRCFGVAELATSIANAWRTEPASYGLLDALRNEGLGDADVPLALISWSTGGTQFIDMWAVRRRIAPTSSMIGWSLPSSVRRAAEAEAAFLQFQEQVTDLLSSGLSQATLSGIRAVDYFQ